MIEALETDLCLASQLRGLSRVYRAVTHDLRAPLHSMVLNLELLRQSLDGAGGDEERAAQLEWVGVLKDEVERLNRSLQALLAETAPPPDHAREIFDAREVLREIERLLQPQARLQEVDLRVDFPETEVPILGYRDRIKQAILNVAINALEVMPEGGQLGLRLESSDGAARLAIEDSGPGHPPGGPGADLRPPLHHQDQRHRHRALRGALDHRVPRRPDRGRERARGRQPVRDPPAVGGGGGRHSRDVID